MKEFTTPCFIRKNTQELRDKLAEVGYEICPCCKFENAVWLNNLIWNGTIHGVGFWDDTTPAKSVEEALEYFLYDDNGRSVDCGEDEELFLELCSKCKEE